MRIKAFYSILVMFYCCLFTVSISAIELNGKTTLKSPCDSIPANCAPGGVLNVECICRLWCSLGCGGAACNCDLLPLKKNSSLNKNT